MKLEVKSNKQIIEMPKVAFDKFSSDQKKNYNVIDKNDAPEEKKQIVSNAVEPKKEKVEKPEETK
jgi:hypothetical protein